MRSFGWALIQYDGCPYTWMKMQCEDTDTQKNTMWRRRKSLEWFDYKPRYTWNYQNLEKARKEGSSPIGFDGSVILSTLHFELWASRTLRQYMSVLVSHSVCGTWLRQLWETQPRLPPATCRAYSQNLALGHRGVWLEIIWYSDFLIQLFVSSLTM